MPADDILITYKSEAGPITGVTVKARQAASAPIPIVGDYVRLSPVKHLAGDYRVASRCFVYTSGGLFANVEIMVDEFRKQ